MTTPAQRDQIEVKLVRSVDMEAVKTLYMDAGWWQDAYDEHPEFIEKLPEKSALFAAAFHKKKMIGMGRALSDRVSDAYIQDVVVFSRYRGAGVGSMIIQALIGGLRAMGVDWIGLIGEPGTRSFYQRLGFEEMKDHIPFKLKG